MKRCPSCLVPKDESEFGKCKSRRDGLSCYCLECKRKKSRALARRPDQKAKKKAYYEANSKKSLAQAKKRWHAKKAAYEPVRQRWAAENRDKMLAYYEAKGASHREFVDSLKAGKPCVDCGLVFAPYVMEYDHVRGVKRFSIGKMANHRRERVIEEIAKCDLVCCVCHRIRSHARRKPARTQKLMEFRKWLADKKNHPCADCGEIFPHEAMDFDHVRGRKVVQITDMWSWGREKVLAELAKCELVCANCHRKRTVQQLRRVA